MQKITKEIYLARQKKEDTGPERVLCLKCLHPLKNCFCSFIEPFDPEIKFLLLMHPMEVKREKAGTGRFCHLTLKNSEILMGVDFTEDTRLNALLKDERYFPVLLYPGEKTLNISKGELKKTDFQGKTLLLIILDGTWPCAKKMMRLSKNLHELPRVSFTLERQSAFAIKQQPGDFCLSTIEAIHEFLNIWERMGNATYAGKQEALMKVFKALIDFQIKCAEDPTLQSYRKKKGYTKKSERKPAKKWEKRKIFF